MAKLFLFIEDVDRLEEDMEVRGTLYASIKDMEDAGWMDTDEEYAVLEIDTDKLLKVVLKSTLVITPVKSKKSKKS